MIITAVAIGTRGDVQPLAELGKEMVRRGHDFRIAAQEAFRGLIEGKGVSYLHLDGDADYVCKLMVTDYVKSTDFLKGCRTLYRSTPGILDQIAEAVRGSDLVMYGLLAGFARHACDLYGIPCIRLFYSPFDKTNLYSLYTDKHNSPLVGMTYLTEEPGMNLLTVQLANEWRVKHGLRKWKMTDDYRKQNGRPVPTFYPVSPLLMPPDPKWGKHIHVTGYWYHPLEDRDYVPERGLEAFLEKGEKPVFIAFGKAESPELARLQSMALETVKELGLRAVIQAFQLTAEEKNGCADHIYFVDHIPYSWIFQRVRAVVHHGGCSTNGLGLWAGCATLIIALALDQYYYGRTVHELGLGPEPLYIRKKLCTKQQLKAAFLELVTDRYQEKLKAAAQTLRQEEGCRMAAELIEEMGAKVQGIKGTGE